MRHQSLNPLSLIIVLILTLFVSAIAQSQTPTQSEPELSYGLLIDNSGSLRTEFNQIIAASKLIAANNRAADETFVVRFTDSKRIKRLQNFTRDKEALSDAIDDIYLEGGQTAILDAVYQSAEYLAQNSFADTSARRWALILITDGEDRESRHALADVLQLLHEKKIQIYAVGLMAQLEKDKGKKASQQAASFLTNLATETGGKAFFPQSADELKANAGDMLNVIRIR